MTNPDQPEPGLDAAYALNGPEQIKRLYANWAESYDTEFVAARGYELHNHVAAAFIAAGGKGPVLDLGAGTGVLGPLLQDAGIGPIDAADLSAEMLQKAAARGCYRALITDDLLGIKYTGPKYAGIVSSGTFTHGHLGAWALAPMLRLCQSDALVAISINAEHFSADGFGEVLDGLGGRISRPKLTEVSIYSKRDEQHGKDTAFATVFSVI